MPVLIPEFRWPEPETVAEEKLVSDVRTYGCHVMKVFSEEGGPPFSYSIGLFLSYGQPEVVIVGLNNETSHTIINDIATHSAQGESFPGGTTTSALLEGYDVHFLDVDEEQYEDHFGYALWFYQSLSAPFPAVQMVWPDRAGKFPWQPGFEPSLVQIQRLLGPPG